MTRCATNSASELQSLLDVNVFVALLDAAHVHHRTARRWMEEHELEGWASCPTTQNGTIRVLSTPVYPNAVSVSVATTLVDQACAGTRHEFWADDVTLTDATRIDRTRIHGPRQITDVYLLALAVSHHGRIVTLDGRIPTSPAIGATSKNLLVI